MKQGVGLALVALTFFPFAVDHFEVPRLVVLATACALFFSQPRAAPRALVVFLALLFGAALVTTLTSTAPAISSSALISLAVISLFGLGGAAMSFRPVLWTTWPLAAWAFVQALGWDFIEWSDAARWCGGLRPFSTLGHPTQLGVWMAACCVLALEEASTHRSRGMFATALLAAVTCGLTLSRAGWLSLGVGVLTWALVRWRTPGLSEPVEDGPAAGRKVLSVQGPLALVVFVIAVVGLAGPSAVLERVTNFFVAPTRVQLWGTGLAGFLQHPALGWGLDTFLLVDQSLRHPDAWRYEWGGTAGHAHAVLPQVLATQGLVGAVASLLAVAVVLRAWRRSPPEAGAAAVVVLLAVAAQVTFFNVAVQALGLVVLARSLRDDASFSLGRWLEPVSLLLLFVVSLQLGASTLARAQPLSPDVARLEPWNPQWPAMRGKALEEAGRWDDAAAAYAQAARLAPLGVFEANVGRVAAKRGDAETSRAAFDRARRLAPLDARVALDAAEASARLGDLALAEGTLRSVLSLYPSDGPAWLELARLRLRTRQVVEARAALEAGLQADWRDWPEGMALARELLARVHSATGDAALAAEVAAGPAVFATPGDACGAPAFLRR